jgi:hypothetical protein
MFDATARVLPARYREGKIRAVTSTELRVFACYYCCLCLSSEIDKKLIGLLRKYEELYDMASKKYSDCFWKENCGDNSEFSYIYNSCNSQCFFFFVTSINVFK